VRQGDAVTTPDRVHRVRAAAGITRLALQQIEDELAADVTPAELVGILREFHHEADPQDGVLGSLAQLLTVAAQRAEHLGGDGEASCPLHEAAAYVCDSVGQRIYYATRALDAQGEDAP
jgi:hypothetical protein